jgi:D-alanyl-D-alanine endopeptidase (penicillin-binding protein 7)
VTFLFKLQGGIKSIQFYIFKLQSEALGPILRSIFITLGLLVFALTGSISSAYAAQSERKVESSAKKNVPVKRKVPRKSALLKQKLTSRAEIVPLKPSFGQIAGLHGSQDTLALKSSVALVVDQETNEVLFSKNDQAVLPIASLTKLMTGLLVSEARLPMNEIITISQADVDTEKGSSSRLQVGTQLSRGELLHLALMSSENRAAHALGRSYPGGMTVFVNLMNTKAHSIGMSDTNYAEPTGLSSKNQSSARDLAKLVKFAYGDPVLRELSTSPGHQVAVGKRTLQYNNTNRLVKNPAWDIGLQKTGYISEAGQCLVMQTKIAGRKLIMVFLDSTGKLSRVADAERVRRWVESSPSNVSRSAPIASNNLADKVAAIR